MAYRHRLQRPLARLIVQLAWLGFFTLCAVPALAQNCPGADPNDSTPDSAALQSCLDNNSAVYLQPGYPGYIIDTRLWFRSWNSVMSSVGGKATLKAHPDLTRAMIRVDGANYYTISELILDGNRQNRTRNDLCTAPEQGFYAGAHGSNLIAEGSGYTLHHIDTINAMCGSGLEAKGENFEIYSVYSANNGDEAPGGRWADGITLVRCDGGYVHHNYMVDNTDIGLVIFRGSGCNVRFNTVVNTSRYAFAGIKVGDPGLDSSASLSGSSVHDNEVTAGYNLLTFGLLVGHHPWDANKWMTDVGEVSYNSISGAMANLVVDGIQAGTIVSNAMSNAQGTRALTCSYTANYTADHFGNATLQGGYVNHSFDPGCQ